MLFKRSRLNVWPQVVLLARHLIINPRVRLFQTLPEGNVGLPVKILLNERIVTVPAVDPLGRIELVVALELDAGDILGHGNEIVDGDAFTAAEVDGEVDRLAVHDGAGALQAIGDVHETAPLSAVAPNFDLMPAGEFRRDDFAADGRRRLFPASIVSAKGTVDIMVA